MAGTGWLHGKVVVPGRRRPTLGTGRRPGEVGVPGGLLLGGITPRSTRMQLPAFLSTQAPAPRVRHGAHVCVRTLDVDQAPRVGWAGHTSGQAGPLLRPRPTTSGLHPSGSPRKCRSLADSLTPSLGETWQGVMSVRLPRQEHTGLGSRALEAGAGTTDSFELAKPRRRLAVPTCTPGQQGKNIRHDLGAGPPSQGPSNLCGLGLFPVPRPQVHRPCLWVIYAEKRRRELLLT